MFLSYIGFYKCFPFLGFRKEILVFHTFYSHPAIYFPKFLTASYNLSSNYLFSFFLLLRDVRHDERQETHEKSSTSMHLEELEDPEKFAEEGGKVITGQEYVSRLHELKAELTHAWHVDDRVTSLKLSIEVHFN
ncbi:hypothetical protein DVH24_018902 [Malus domestica]|uniref:Uncharacterized protein n=1 Tax=Malus domestica TaxID=3750 RepID=A0A498HQ58_MALDO|nr:hypothetical protein DVH24_018902 [Malus domestica]